MKNKISDLRNHMFAALERLGNEDMDEENLKKEVARAQAISEVGKTIVESAKTEIMYAKLTGKGKEQSAKFIEEEPEEDATPMIRHKGVLSTQEKTLKKYEA